MLVSYSDVSTCDYADALDANQFMHASIRALWPQTQRLAGPAFTVVCAPGDHLMLHAAIYRAKPGDILVVQGDEKLAMAGGNVCAIAQKRGIQGMIVDGFVRDIDEIAQMQFPVYAKGTFPKPAAKKALGKLASPIQCGDVQIENGDIIVADNDGIAVIPFNQRKAIYEVAMSRKQKDAEMTLEQWQSQHLEKVETTLTKLGFTQ
nr:RraA family protein [Alteromonas ponticola]